MLACQLIWHGKHMYYLANIKIIHAKIYNIIIINATYIYRCFRKILFAFSL